jgi:putative ABC transport system substrate-binding protein
MNKRGFIAGLGSAVAWPVGARGQQAALPVIGLLDQNSPEATSDRMAAFRKGLRDQGYVDGSNVKIEYRFAYNNVARIPELVADLVSRRVAIIAIAAAGPNVPRAAKAATTIIPIVFGTAGDPVQEGLVESINRPGGNATGYTNMAVELTAKRLGLLHTLLPNAKRFAMLTTSIYDTFAKAISGSVHEAATEIGGQIEILNVNTGREIDAAFSNLVNNKTEALLIPPAPLFTNRRVQLVTLAAHYNLPVMYYERPYVEAGGLMSYGNSLTEQAYQVGVYTGRVLRGEKPADLPIMQPTKIEFVINLQTARTIGIAVPANLLALADEVIE